MGILDKFKSKKKEPKLKEHVNAYKRIIELLNVDADTTDKLNSCITNPHTYYDKNTEIYHERGVTSGTDDDTIIWLGIVDTLIQQGKMFEFDYKVELEDFIYGINEINNNDISFDENILDEDSDITDWSKVLYNEWIELGFVLAGMDIESDSYCVFITTQNVFDKLVIEAEKTGHRIALVQDM